MRMPASLTAHDAPAALAQLLQTLEAGMVGVADPVTLDAGDLQQFDSAALAVLLELRRRVISRGRRFAVSNMPDNLKALADVYGVQPLLTGD